MKGWTLAWGDDHRPRVVESSEALNRLLGEAGVEAQGTFTMAELVSPLGASCSIGLGRQRSVVTFSASADPPYFLSRGDETSVSDPLVFFYNGHWTEFGVEASVPADQAVLALKEFFETGEQPSSVALAEV